MPLIGITNVMKVKLPTIQLHNTCMQVQYHIDNQ